MDEPQPRIVGAAKNMGRGMVERYGDRPGRSIDEPAFTLRASAGGTEPGGFVWKLDDGTTRKMTIEEASILQTYISPDTPKGLTMHNLKALDLFAGTGWGVACQRLGIDEMGVEIMPEAIATREANGMHTIYHDVWDGLTGPKLSYDLLIASPPCQTFSMAGHGAGRKALDEVVEAIELHAYKDPQALRDFGDKHDPRTALVLTPLAHVWRDRPRLVTFEQVPTVLPVWEACATIMRDLGYSVAVGVLQAEQYGVPQTRKRAILVARLDGEAKLPTPTHSRYYINEPARLDKGVLPWVSMAQALGWTDDEAEGSTFTQNNKLAHQAVRTLDQPAPTVTAGHDSGNRGFTDPDGQFFVATVEQVSALQSYPTALRSNYGTGGDASKRGKRLAEQPAPTLTSKADRNKWDGERNMTVSEAAALQSYPAKPFEWRGSKTKQMLQVGNAVPPLLAQAILTELTAPAVMPVTEPTLLDLAAA